MRTDLSFNSSACSTFQRSVCYNTQLFALIAQRNLPQVSGNAFVQVFPPSSETAWLLCCVSLKVQQCTEQEAKTQWSFFFMGDCNRGQNMLFKDAADEMIVFWGSSETGKLETRKQIYCNSGHQFDKPDEQLECFSSPPHWSVIIHGRSYRAAFLFSPIKPQEKMEALIKEINGWLIMHSLCQTVTALLS